jgi:hypothetical protein
MAIENAMMVGAATVFVVSDMAKSIEHYRLRFTVTFQYGNPTFYACLCRDEALLHLLAAHETKRLPGNGGICVFVRTWMVSHRVSTAWSECNQATTKIKITACVTLMSSILMEISLHLEWDLPHRPEVRFLAPVDVRFGSIADIRLRPSYVRSSHQ